MVDLLIAGVALFFGGIYGAGVLGAERDLRRSGQWIEPPRPLPPARLLREGSTTHH